MKKMLRTCILEPGGQGSYSSNPSTLSVTGTVTYKAEPARLELGHAGHERPYGGQAYPQTGYGMGNNIRTYQQAQHEPDRDLPGTLITSGDGERVRAAPRSLSAGRTDD
jgi:hypothetical protein